VRRWLTYLTLFVAALVLIGDFMAVVRGLLSGELVPRFLLKAAVVAAISGIVFRHYLDDLRRDESETPGAARAGAWLARTGVAAMIVAGLAGLIAVGTPGRARTRQFDLLRVEALQKLSTRVETFQSQEGRLPAALAELRSPAPGRAGAGDPLDPLTRAPYEYARTDSTHFTLCAVFAAEDSLGPGGGLDPFWKHHAGRHCFGFGVRRALPALP